MSLEPADIDAVADRVIAKLAKPPAHQAAFHVTLSSSGAPDALVAQLRAEGFEVTETPAWDVDQARTAEARHVTGSVPYTDDTDQGAVLAKAQALGAANGAALVAHGVG